MKFALDNLAEFKKNEDVEMWSSNTKTSVNGLDISLELSPGGEIFIKGSAGKTYRIRTANHEGV